MEANVQEANTEHDHCLRFLSPIPAQPDKLLKRKPDYPYIKRNANTSIRPCLSIHVQTMPLVLSIPLRPRIANGLALKCVHCRTRYCSKEGEDDRAIRDLPESGGRKDTEVQI